MDEDDENQNSNEQDSTANKSSKEDEQESDRPESPLPPLKPVPRPSLILSSSHKNQNNPFNFVRKHKSHDNTSSYQLMPTDNNKNLQNVTGKISPIKSKTFFFIKEKEPVNLNKSQSNKFLGESSVEPDKSLIMYNDSNFNDYNRTLYAFPELDVDCEESVKFDINANQINVGERLTQAKKISFKEKERSK